MAKEAHSNQSNFINLLANIIPNHEHKQHFTNDDKHVQTAGRRHDMNCLKRRRGNDPTRSWDFERQPNNRKQIYVRVVILNGGS